MTSTQHSKTIEPVSGSRDGVWNSDLGRIALWVAGFSLLVRIVFMGMIDLLPEEAYYWNYARHLDIGYLDHPPLSAWLIWLSASVFGNTELGVRLPAFLTWLVLASYMYRLTNDSLGQKAALGCLVLLSVLPIYWSVGFLLTPDAPLYAAWAATMFYARRAIVDSKTNCWLGVGLGIGLGMLSKYTMALLGLSIVAFLLIDSPARKSLARPEPYLALVMSILLFLPVIIWNSQNDWASFAFQGSRRWSFPPSFHLHILFASALLLLTPVGLWESLRVIARRAKELIGNPAAGDSASLNARLAIVLCGLPLAVFVLHSLANQSKLNWTGPVWLAILPWVAQVMVSETPAAHARRFASIRRAWAVSIVTLMLVIPAGLTWILLGAPGLNDDSWYKLPVAWEEFGREVESIEREVQSQTGQEPLIVGIDKYWVASEASFYDTPDTDSLEEFAGRGVIGRSDLMWSRWIERDMLQTRTMILVGLNEADMEHPSLRKSFGFLGPVIAKSVNRKSRRIGRFYWRLASSHIQN